MNQPLPGVLRQDSAGRAGRVALAVRKAPDRRSFIARQHATYPFHICRPHYVAGDPDGMATLYLQSIAGGLFEHDRLAMDVSVDAGAALHLTSQGATIVHAMTGGRARLSTTLAAGPESIVELLPEATILFPGAELELTTDVVADGSAIVLVGESFIAHDPTGSGAPFRQVLSEVTFRTPGGHVHARDRQIATGQAFQMMSVAPQSALTAYGCVQLWAPQRSLDAVEAAVADTLNQLAGSYCGVSRLPGSCGLAMRILAADGAGLRSAMAAVWCATRQSLFGTIPARRRK